MSTSIALESTDPSALSEHEAATSSIKSPRRLPASPENLLARYFRDVGTLPVLRPQQEFELARIIEDHEVSMWSHILSHPRLVDRVLSYFETRLEENPPAFAQLRRCSRMLVSGSGSAVALRERHERWCEDAARRIRAEDVDRESLDTVVDHLRRLAAGETDTLFNGCRVNGSSKSFAKFLRKVLALRRTSQAARNEFVQANLRLVVTIARRFNFGQIPLHDLIQEGNIGLIKAVGRYDHRRGFRFSTYASWWIRHAITRALADKGRMVRVPVHMQSTYQKFNRASRELSAKLGRAATAEEVGHSASISADKLDLISDHMPSQFFSLDSCVTDDDDRRFVEMVQDEHTISPPDSIGDRQVFAQVQEIFGELKPIEADVLRKRFGLDGREHTLVEIGSAYELSRERIRQIQEQALGKIRRALMRRNAM